MSVRKRQKSAARRRSQGKRDGRTDLPLDPVHGRLSRGFNTWLGVETYISCVCMNVTASPPALNHPYLEVAQVHLVPLLQPRQRIVPNGRHDVGLVAGVRDGRVHIACVWAFLQPRGKT